MRDAVFSAGDVPGVALVEVVGGAPDLEDVTFEDPTGAAICLRASGPEAAVVVRDSDFGCWLGVSAEAGAVDVSASRFAGHDTGVRIEGAGSALDSLTFSGVGAHVSLGPDWFAGGVVADLGLAGHDYGAEGEPFVVGGVLSATATLVPLFEDEPLLLTGMTVRRGGVLRAAPGLELRPGGTTITVDGVAELDQVLFARIEGPALHWREGATGYFRRSRLEYAERGAFPGLRITDSSPTVEDSEIDGGVSGGVGVEVFGRDDVDTPATPSIVGNTLENLRIGVHVVGDAEPVLADNTFVEVQDEVVENDLGGD